MASRARNRNGLRILTVGSLYPPHHLGGYELIWQTAVHRLRSAGHDVRVLCVEDRLRPGAPEPEPAAHRALRWYWHRHEFPRLRAWERLRLERHNHAVLLEHLDRLAPDVVSWWSMGGMSLSLIEKVRRLGIPAVGWVADDWMVYGPQVDQWSRSWTGPRRGRLQPVVEAVSGLPAGPSLDEAARWIFCSEAVRRTAMQLHPGLRDTRVLHPGVSDEFKPAPERDWTGRLLYASRLDERKGLATLIDAVQEMPETTLLVAGHGDPRIEAQFRERARSAGARVLFEPALDRRDLSRRYAESDAVIFPVEWPEPWGLVPLEAMAMGRPVVATGTGGSGEYLVHEENALLFPPGDAGALRGCVERLKADPALRGRLRAGGLGTAARLTEDAWVREVLAQHEEMAHAPVAGSGRVRR